MKKKFRKNMADKLLADVNICLDLLLDRRPFVEFSGRIFELAEKKKITLFVYGLSFDTLFYIMRPSLGPARATNLLKKFLNQIHIAPLNGNVVKKALDAEWKDLEDALQYFSAVETGCDCLITRNKTDFKVADKLIAIQSPDEYLKM